MIRELTEAAREIAADTSVRVVVFSGEGRSFCAGGDLAWMKAQFEAEREGRVSEAKRLAAMLRAIDELPQFVIGAVHGAGYGGGVGLMAVCDLVIAADTARFALTETRLGLIPATIVPYLHRRMGEDGMRRVALHAQAFDAAAAKDLGLVSEIVTDGELSAAADRHIVQALSCAPGAVAAAKQLFRRIAVEGAGEADAIAALAARWESEEARAGIAAFFAKEKPPWTSES
jgi:methylglutaconyl-CoA hydratase